MYGVKTWGPIKVDGLRLGVFERKVLRKIYGHTDNMEIKI